ncbi:MAG: hypothetical protein PHY93_19920, partial [Bacteriovorax sp.]|nr:hypothetical protein [Bacteriovorax sp.]
MSKRRIFDILIGLIFLSLLGLYVYDHYIVPTKPKIIARPGYTRANDILRKKTKIPENILNTTATSSACTLFLKNSAEISMNDYANEYIDHQIDAILKTCAGAFPTTLQSKIDNAILKCKTSTREHLSKECYGALITAKTSSVATVIRSDIDPKDLPATILLQLIADKFSNGELLEHPERSLELIDALLAHEPSYLGGYKVKLLLLSMSSLNKEEYYQEMFQDTLDEARRLSPNDPEVREIALAEKGKIFKQQAEANPDDNKKEKKNNKEFIEYLELESAKHPAEWIYDYYK